MSNAIYRIRPLKWKKEFADWRQAYEAYVPMGSYTVCRTTEDCDPKLPWGPWRWEYDFREYHDEGKYLCGNCYFDLTD